MNLNVRMIAAFVLALTLGTGAARALPPPARAPQIPTAPTVGIFEASRAWLASLFGLGGADRGRLSAVRGSEGSHLDPDGLLSILPPLLPPPPCGSSTVPH